MNLCFSSSNWVIIPQKQQKKNCCAKSEGAVDHCTETRWFKKFLSSYDNFDDQAKSGWPKTVDLEAVFQDIEAHPRSSSRNVLSELSISQSSVVRYLHDIAKSIQICRIIFYFIKILQNF